MNAPQFNHLIDGAVREALNEGVAKQRMSAIDIAGVLANHLTQVLNILNQAMNAHAEAAKAAAIVIPFERKLKPPGPPHNGELPKPDANG